MKELAKKGGKARAEALTTEERQEASRVAAAARWLRAVNEGVLRLGEADIACYVLGDGRRMLSQAQMISALGMHPGSNPRLGDDRLSNFIAGNRIKPHVSEDLSAMIKHPVPFRTCHGNQAHGYEATMLSGLCEAILEADRVGLQKQQKEIARQAWVLMKGFSRVGIIALVDEATGYQYDRARDELQKILKAYISEELLPWVARFPHSFYREVFRLHGWEYREGSVKGPLYIGRFIDTSIYKQLPPGVRDELRNRNPADEKNRRRHKHHQFLTEDTGIGTLDKLIAETTALMRASLDKGEFWRLFKRAFPKSGQQLELAVEEPKEDL
jgi:hypothetical protein